MGRAPENSLPIEDDHVSRRHAIIQAQGENEFWLVDLGSSNGTSLNGRRITHPVALHKGDVIELGATRLVFQTEALTEAHQVGAELQASTKLSIKQVTCWLLVADIVDSTRLARCLAPEELPRVMGTWFKTCRQIIDDSEGRMLKYLGDGFFCYWPDEAGSGAKVKEAIRTLQMKQEKNDPPFRIVLHHGTVVAGSVPTMSEPNLHGTQVNFAFRMEKLAGALRRQLLFSEPAYGRLGLGAEAHRIAQAPLEGFEGTFSFYAPASSQA